MVFDALAWVLGFAIILHRRRGTPSPAQAVPFDVRLWLLAGAVVGAAVGAKLLAWVEDPDIYLTQLGNPAAWLGGKTVVGGLLGGWLGVEVAKKLNGVTLRTGDAYVLPLMVGMSVGRIGCFLTGLDDHTYGVATSLPWAVDFGDGVPRHPTQLYDIVMLVMLAAIALPLRGRPPGTKFRIFIGGYCVYRLLIEFLKPSDKPLLGLSAIQLAALLGATAALVTLLRHGAPPGGKPAEMPQIK